MAVSTKIYSNKELNLSQAQRDAAYTLAVAFFEVAGAISNRGRELTEQAGKFINQYEPIALSAILSNSSVSNQQRLEAIRQLETLRCAFDPVAGQYELKAQMLKQVATDILWYLSNREQRKQHELSYLTPSVALNELSLAINIMTGTILQSRCEPSWHNRPQTFKDMDMSALDTIMMWGKKVSAYSSEDPSYEFSALTDANVDIATLRPMMRAVRHLNELIETDRSMPNSAPAFDVSMDSTINILTDSLKLDAFTQAVGVLMEYPTKEAMQLMSDQGILQVLYDYNDEQVDRLNPEEFLSHVSDNLLNLQIIFNDICDNLKVTKDNPDYLLSPDLNSEARTANTLDERILNSDMYRQLSESGALTLHGFAIAECLSRIGSLIPSKNYYLDRNDYEESIRSQPVAFNIDGEDITVDLKVSSKLYTICRETENGIERGGRIEDESCLSQKGSCWLARDGDNEPRLYHGVSASHAARISGAVTASPPQPVLPEEQKAFLEYVIHKFYLRQADNHNFQKASIDNNQPRIAQLDKAEFVKFLKETVFDMADFRAWARYTQGIESKPVLHFQGQANLAGDMDIKAWGIVKGKAFGCIEAERLFNLAAGSAVIAPIPSQPLLNEAIIANVRALKEVDLELRSLRYQASKVKMEMEMLSFIPKEQREHKAPILTDLANSLSERISLLEKARDKVIEVIQSKSTTDKGLVMLDKMFGLSKNNLDIQSFKSDFNTAVPTNLPLDCRGYPHAERPSSIRYNIQVTPEQLNSLLQSCPKPRDFEKEIKESLDADRRSHDPYIIYPTRPYVPEATLRYIPVPASTAAEMLTSQCFGKDMSNYLSRMGPDELDAVVSVMPNLSKAPAQYIDYSTQLEDGSKVKISNFEPLDTPSETFGKQVRDAEANHIFLRIVAAHENISVSDVTNDQLLANAPYILEYIKDICAKDNSLWTEADKKIFEAPSVYVGYIAPDQALDEFRSTIADFTKHQMVSLVQVCLNDAWIELNEQSKEMRQNAMQINNADIENGCTFVSEDKPVLITGRHENETEVPDYLIVYSEKENKFEIVETQPNVDQPHRYVPPPEEIERETTPNMPF